MTDRLLLPIPQFLLEISLLKVWKENDGQIILNQIIRKRKKVSTLCITTLWYSWKCWKFWMLLIHILLEMDICFLWQFSRCSKVILALFWTLKFLQWYGINSKKWRFQSRTSIDCFYLSSFIFFSSPRAWFKPRRTFSFMVFTFLMGHAALSLLVLMWRPLAWWSVHPTGAPFLGLEFFSLVA